MYVSFRHTLSLSAFTPVLTILFENVRTHEIVVNDLCHVCVRKMTHKFLDAFCNVVCTSIGKILYKSNIDSLKLKKSAEIPHFFIKY